MKCKSCKFWKALPGTNESRGQCRRLPPIAEENFIPAGISGWPITSKVDWCGEFKILTPEANSKSPAHVA